MIRFPLILLPLIPLALPAATVSIETRGQAQLVARRHAIDAAVADLRVQARALLVRGEETLGEWLEAHPGDPPLLLEQALRDAEVILDEPSDGRWSVTLAVSVSALNEALEPVLSRGLAADETLRLRGRGSAPIRWGSLDANVTDRPPAPLNLPLELPTPTSPEETN
ncbi:hypothetical protein JXA47_01475 [Candidatus Sumerlaeota bacterium]|nr:hypothetical protein [Candidatus Sumerlaeota bacterium]